MSSVHPRRSNGSTPDYLNQQSILPTASVPRHPATLALGSAPDQQTNPPTSPPLDSSCSKLPKLQSEQILVPNPSQPATASALPDYQPPRTLPEPMKQIPLSSPAARPPFTLSAVPRLAPKLRAPATTPHTPRARAGAVSRRRPSLTREAHHIMEHRTGDFQEQNPPTRFQ